MSLLKSEDSRKWINSFCALIAILCGFILIRFTNQAGDWFNLEASVPNFLYIAQAVGLILGFCIFLYLLKSSNIQSYLDEVYGELLKVVWPKKEVVSRMTFGLVIALSIISCIFVAIDFTFRKLIELILN